VLSPTPVALAVFPLSGTYIACEEVAEKALGMDSWSRQQGNRHGAARRHQRGRRLRVERAVGTLWSLFPGRLAYGFLAAASLQLLGATALAFQRTSPSRATAA